MTGIHNRLSTTSGRSATIDWYRACNLSDVGADGLMASEVIGPDGVVYLVLVDMDRIGDPRVVFNPDCPDAPHEQVD